MSAVMGAARPRYFLVRFCKIGFLCFLAVACLADNLVYIRIDRSVIEKRIQAVPADDVSRIATLRTQFKAAGCAPDQIKEQDVPDVEVPNLVCTLPGPEPGAIVIATRLSSKAHGE